MALARRLQAGDMSAFAELIQRYQDRVYNTVWRICGHAEDARDLTQDAFLKAHQSIGSFRGQATFYTWLFRIAVNLTLSSRRAARRRGTVSLDAPLQATSGNHQASNLAARMQDPSPHDPSDRQAATELHDQVVGALNKLDEEFRAVVVLRDMEGFDYRQIAEALGIAPGTVKSRLHRARSALRDMLEPMLAPER
ncbi:MAG: RNA polymerase sigma factor [Phycisphaerae bacterium]